MHTHMNAHFSETTLTPDSKITFNVTKLIFKTLACTYLSEFILTATVRTTVKQLQLLIVCSGYFVHLKISINLSIFYQSLNLGL